MVCFPSYLRLHREPTTAVIELAAYRAERERRGLWIAGRKAADSDSWRYYLPADRPAYRPVPLPGSDTPLEVA